jgi:hypothetical protein
VACRRRFARRPSNDPEAAGGSGSDMLVKWIAGQASWEGERHDLQLAQTKSR